jgi:hypothetical protein
MKKKHTGRQVSCFHSTDSLKESDVKPGRNSLSIVEFAFGTCRPHNGIHYWTRIRGSSTVKDGLGHQSVFLL